MAWVLSWELTAYRVLMVWVYERTRSLLVAMSSRRSSSPPAPQPRSSRPLTVSGVAPQLTDGYAGVEALAWWAVVAVLAVANRGRLMHQPLRRQAA